MRARQTIAEHADPEVRTRAEETAAKWESVIAGMQAGTIQVGSRTPTAAPAWVTLDVATGGFATGSHAAAGPLRDHERAIARRAGIAESRVALNLHHLISGEAAALVASGCYRVDVPEEGALLVVAWLRERGEIARANELVETLAPWFEVLRFYPVPAERPVDIGETMRLQDVGTTVEEIATVRQQKRFATMRSALLVWKPLYERAIVLFAETVDGELPQLVGRGIVGGTPGTVWPDGWQTRVAQLAADHARAGAADTERAREASQLIDWLERCARDRKALTPREVHLVRRAIARQVTAHGLPGTPEAQARSTDELRAVAGPLHADLRHVLVKRLRTLPQDGGVDLERALAPVTADEAARFGVPEDSALPPYLAPKVARSCDATLAELVDRGVIGSGEVFARVLPQVTAQVRAHTLDDPSRRLYTALYTAFRRRRGLLLLNYQHQVRFQELPWVAALEAARAPDDAAAARARTAVAGASSVALRAFPYTIVPNKLVTELYALANAADLSLPLVEEIAADIFMGGFSVKFAAAARISARVIAGTLYQRYFAIDVNELARLPVPSGVTSPELAAICVRRAGPTGGTSRSHIAANGKIIEQAQILTTHNLAVLFDALPLGDQLAPHLRPIAETCFRWTLARLRVRTSNWHLILLNLKNAAYAWRQMMFYASFLPDIADFTRWARVHLTRLARVDDELVRRFEPAIRGLELAASGIASGNAAFASGGGRMFTGWTTDRHWLAPPPAPAPTP
jgi:hypothetical protein